MKAESQPTKENNLLEEIEELTKENRRLRKELQEQGERYRKLGNKFVTMHGKICRALFEQVLEAVFDEEKTTCGG